MGSVHGPFATLPAASPTCTNARWVLAGHTPIQARSAWVSALVSYEPSPLSHTATAKVTSASAGEIVTSMPGPMGTTFVGGTVGGAWSPLSL